MRLCLSFVLAVVLLAGCERAGPTEPVLDTPTLTTIQQTIFSRNCALSGCHVGTNAQQGMDLSAGQAHANIVGVPSREQPNLFRVAPGDPDASYLMQKIEGAPGIVGDRMPLGRTPLSIDEIDLIRRWIAEGAQDN